MPAPGRARVACVYRFDDDGLALASMDRIRFLRMAEALARAGHEVDVIAGTGRVTELAPRLRRVPLRAARWERYDVIKASLHRGFAEVARHGGGDHPFIVSSLGAIVGEHDRPGVYFFGDIHRQLIATQHDIANHARAVVTLTDENELAWTDTHGPNMLRLRVPTGVDAVVPPSGSDPYRALGLSGRAVLFAGNLYSDQQLEVNATWIDRLNRLGRALQRRGLSLVAMGTGQRSALDPAVVTDLGPVAVEHTWDWQRHAVAGVVIAHGPTQDNESSKIYYYLRTELPVLCEAPVPNRWLIEQTGLGSIIELDDMETMADAAASFAGRRRGENGVADWMASEHSWDERAARYEALFDEAASLRVDKPRRRRPVANGACRVRRRTHAANIVLLSPGLVERAVWGERIVARALALSLPRAFPGASVQIVDAGRLDLLEGERVDLLVSMCTGPRPPWRVDEIARRVDGITMLWVLNHPQLLDEFAEIEVDGYLSNSRRAVEILNRARPAAWCPLGIDPELRRLPTVERYRSDVVYLGGGGIGNKNPRTTHHYLDPAKQFEFDIWGSHWSTEYWAAVDGEDETTNDWQRYWRGPLPVGDEAALYSSAGVVLGYHEDGQRQWGMWNNRVFEALGAEALLICDAAEGLAEEFGDAVVTTSGGPETSELIARYLGDPAERRRRGAEGRRQVMERYTYDHSALRMRDAYLSLCDRRGLQPARVADAPPLP